jgi:hypothetical protein
LGAAVEYRASMATEGDELPVPRFVTFPLFPFEGDLRVKQPPHVIAQDLATGGGTAVL